MADAAYAIFCRDARRYTGHFVLDEEILREEGMTDFDRHCNDPNEKPELDLFVAAE
ncbi:MAG TPA: hypothetical protein VE999_12100 [Gemmataceae bacterium]|nr:hypothetical protein [Gemmataceae bacterium]